MFSISADVSAPLRKNNSCLLSFKHDRLFDMNTNPESKFQQDCNTEVDLHLVLC